MGSEMCIRDRVSNVKYTFSHLRCHMKLVRWPRDGHTGLLGNKLEKIIVCKNGILFLVLSEKLNLSFKIIRMILSHIIMSPVINN